MSPRERKCVPVYPLGKELFLIYILTREETSPSHLLMEESPWDIEDQVPIAISMQGNIGRFFPDCGC
jgi:hypothetical protein